MNLRFMPGLWIMLRQRNRTVDVPLSAEIPWLPEFRVKHCFFAEASRGPSPVFEIARPKAPGARRTASHSGECAHRDDGHDQTTPERASHLR